MGPALDAVEDNGLEVSTVEEADPLLEDVIDAGCTLGWRGLRDVNATDEERIGYTTAMIRDGRRVSAADDRAVGVIGCGTEFEAAREVILATGAIATPKILQLSGIGPAETLRSAGVDVVVDSPHVGTRLREHRVFWLQFRLADDLGYNALLNSDAAGLEY
jgi:choline dehydrogenase-like flavoprotein